MDVAAEAPALHGLLKRHTLALLGDPQRRNLFPDGGIKLSSTSSNSWMSKIALFQHVAREVLHLCEDPAIADLFAKADAAHVKWQTDGSGYWACSDQFVNGVAMGSRYYPRIITAALWLTRSDKSADRADQGVALNTSSK
jgi:xylan 1,4-beta-xylosidase